ncbi:MAG: TauD/TfdA family dioxygenase [Proteobacteria bacterium]|nr:TauD/TfdA family dioxygenase [Pseudomonadota bacterium]MBT7110151.1 TauD/TfdA family dioxygenase [Pseudomonadota bacterium]
MQKFIDLSSESIEDVARIPSCANRGWVATEIRKQDWSVDLNDDALGEIRAMAAQMTETRLPTLLRHPDQFEIPSLAAAYRKIKAICDHGVGFAVLDGLPMAEFETQPMIDIYWTLGQLIGRNVAQKWDGTMIYDVTDTGQEFGYGVRGSATSVELNFHTDNAFGMRVPDYVGLFCEHAAESGGLSRFCSLYTVHNRLEANFPNQLQRLFKPMLFDRQAEHHKNAPKTSWAPFFSWKNGRLRCRANTSLVRKGYKVADTEMDQILIEALDAVERVTTSPDLWVEAPLERGQIQYLNNHELGHYRSSFEDSTDPAKRRHLYRLWHRQNGSINYDG